MSTEGMEILRVVAKISLRLDERSSGPDLLIVHGMQTECLLGLTPAHVRQARAIVTAAERKEVNAVSMDFEAWRCQHDETLFCPDEGCSKRDGCARDRGWRPGQLPPTAGPIPEAGARRWRHKKRGSVIVEIGRGRLQTTTPQYFLADMDEMVIYLHETDGTLWCRARVEFEDGRFEELAPSPQPPAPAVSEETEEILEAIDSVIAQEAANRAIPAPAEGGTDVGELLNRLNMWLDNDYVRRCPDYIKNRSLDHAIGGVFDALAAQAAEIERLRSAHNTCERDFRRHIGEKAAALAAKEVERREQVSVREVRIAELEAALIARKKEPSR